MSAETNLKKGDAFYMNDDLYEIVGFDDESVFIERLHDNSIKKYTLVEATQLITDIRKKGWYKGPWPFSVHGTVCGEEWMLEGTFSRLGMSEEDRAMFKHVVPDLVLELEIHRNGDVHIISVQGQTLDRKIKCH